MNQRCQIGLQFAVLAVLIAALTCGCVPRVPRTAKITRDVEYARVDGQSLKLDIYAPKKPVGKLPVIVWLHGGGWNHGNKDFCPIGFLAGQNVAVVSVDYRLDSVALFPAQLYDCKGAIRWLRAHADQLDLNTDHIGIFGVSAGAHLGLLLATTARFPDMEGTVGGNLDYSSRVQCVCALYPPTDLDRLADTPETRTRKDTLIAQLLGGPVGDNVEKARAASPMTYVDSNCPPVFLMHGGADTLVPPEQSRIFYTAVRQAGGQARLEIIPGKGHGCIPTRAIADEIFAFFNRNLNTRLHQP